MVDEQQGRKPWDKLPEEPDEAYARFLVFRNLGVGRTIDAAYATIRTSAANRAKSRKGKKSAKSTTRASGQWFKDAATFHWAERAAAWDVEMLRVVVPETITAIFQAIDEFAKVTIETLRSGKVKPRTWVQAIGAITILAGFISPETARSAMDQLRHAVAESIGSGDKGTGST
jgi:hypothetical protein